MSETFSGFKTEIQMTPAQCRAARALLDLEQSEVAEAAGIARNTVNEFEREVRNPRASTVAAIRAALETAGVEFTNGGQPGVKMAKREK